MPFRLQGKFIFLTYARADFDIDEYYVWLTGKLEHLRGAVICRELHADGSPHRHVAIELGYRFDTRNARFFDYNGYHPKAETARNWKAVLKYVKKTEDWKGFGNHEGTEEDDSDADQTGLRGSSGDLFDAARTCDTRSQFIAWCVAKKVPYGYYQECWKLVHGSSATIIRDGDAIEGTISMPYLSFLLYDEMGGRALVLQGPTGVGKTTWALRNAPKPALVVSHIDDLKKCDEPYKSIIFDDMDFTHWPRNAQIHLLDFFLDRSIHARNTNAFIKKGTHKIFTCNTFPFIEDPAIRRRIHVVDLYDIPQL